MTDLLKKYLNDNFDLKAFKVNELSSFIVELTDINNQKMSIMNLLDDIVVYIDGQEYNTYHLNHKNEWIQKVFDYWEI